MMIRATAAIFLILNALPAKAEDFSGKNCRILAESAENASEAMASMVKRTTGDKMAKVIPLLGPDQKRAAETMEKARLSAIGPLQAYADAMAAFAKAMRQCSGELL